MTALAFILVTAYVTVLTMPKKPPLGVLPYRFWCQDLPDPSLDDLLNRFVDVSEAITRYARAGVEPKHEWLVEVGADNWPEPI